MTKKSSNSVSRQALGRGLGSLMRSTMQDVALPEENTYKPAVVEAAVSSSQPKPKEIIIEKELITEPQVPESTQGNLYLLPIEQITTNASQPRQHFSENEIDSLSESIKESGLLQPIIVRKAAAESTGNYEIVAGERRFRAAKKASLSRIPAIVKQLSDQEALQLGIIENVQRSDLNPVEEALAYQRLVSEYGLSQSEVAQTVSKDRVSIANALRLLKLPVEVQALLIDKSLSAGHGRALLMLESADDRRELAQMILKEQLSVRAVEQMVRSGALKKRRKRRSVDKGLSSKSASVLELENRFRRALGTKVSLHIGESNSGELKISFFSKAELESLLERLGA